jgi:hypothetical protein
MHDMDEQDLQKAVEARTKAAARHIVHGLMEGLAKAQFEMRELPSPEGRESEPSYPYLVYVVLQFAREMERLERRFEISPRYRWQEANIRTVLRQLGLELYWLREGLQLDYDPLNPEEL